MRDLDERLRAGREMSPKKKFIVVFMFTGRGLVKDSVTELVLNEYDRSSKFYKLFKAESMIRELSTHNSNAYIVAVFACKRQKHVAEILRSTDEEGDMSSQVSEEPAY